jgi:hypothetical protein
VDSGDSSDRRVLPGAFAICLVCYIPAEWHRRKELARDLAGNPEAA